MLRGQVPSLSRPRCAAVGGSAGGYRSITGPVTGPASAGRWRFTDRVRGYRVNHHLHHDLSVPVDPAPGEPSRLRAGLLGITPPGPRLPLAPAIFANNG